MISRNFVSGLVGSSLFFTFFLTSVVAQEPASDNQGASGDISEMQVKPIRLPVLEDVGGSMFMTPDYKPGIVQLPDNKVIKDVPMKFNIFNNAVMVQKDGREYKLESFQQVSYRVDELNGVLNDYIFRQGYPAIDKNSENTIYQVISAGKKVQLLKYISQKVEDAPTMGQYSRREIVTTVQLYIYMPGGAIKRIKPAKKDLKAALPEYSARIDQIVSANNLKLKSESDIVTLVEELNKP